MANYRASDIEHASDGFWVLVYDMTQTLGKRYYGINVIFDLSKKFKEFVTADPLSKKQSVEDKDKIIRLAQSKLGMRENKTMNEAQKFKKLIQECITEMKQVPSQRQRLKEALRPLVLNMLKEISSVITPEKTKEDKEKENKMYAKDKNERLDKVNIKQQQELETLVHGINKDWLVYWDDYNQLNVDAKNLLRVRIYPKFENNFDIEAMVKLEDRIRVIAVTWEQVKDFVKANFSKLENKTKSDVANEKSWGNAKDRDKNTKEAGPKNDTFKLRTGNVKDTKRDDKMYNEPAVTKDEDQPSAPMKDVDVKDNNKNIKKTSSVKPPKHKNDKKLVTPLTKTKKFTTKNS